MLRRNLWKLTFSLLLVAWAVSTLLPIQDRPFPDYIRAEASAKPAEFAALLNEAVARKEAGLAQSEFVALKQIGKERKIDFTQYFPHLRLEESLRNIEKRNDILLTELLRRSKGRLQLGLDLRGGVAFTLEVDELAAANISLDEREEKLSKAIEIIGNRIDGLGVAEPIIRPVGNNRIEVQLPSVNTKDNPNIIDETSKPARLDFRLVHPTLTPQMTADVPPGYELLTLEFEGARGETGVEELYVKRIPEMTGEMISNSFARPDIYGKPEVILQFTSEGRTRFADVTREIATQGQQAGRLGRLAIVLDGKLYSAPTVRETIDSESAQITGSFSEREALNLANVLNNPLDLPLIVKEQYEVGPSLAADAISSGRLAFIIGTSLTAVFIVAFYTKAGALAIIAMLANVIIILGVMASFGATLSLPGIAGIVLTIGMSVDSNILIFERIREELKLGKSLPAALEAGFEKAFSAILDGNLTTLITAGMMIALGTGAVKGFGVTLTIGIFSTMFAALVVSRLLLDWLVNSLNVQRIPMFAVFQNTNYDFMKYARPAFIASWLVVLIGAGTVIYKGKDIYGIDFTGGDQVQLSFERKVDIAEIRQVATAAGVTDLNITYTQQIGGDAEVLRLTTPFDEAETVIAALQAARPDAGFELAGTARIGPSVGEEIQRNAAWAIFWSLLLILAYVAFRFEFGFGVGAVVSTVHDILITIGLFVLFDRQFNAAMVAAILLVAGYSINDTIVVFDRIREELKLNPTQGLREIINRSLNLTLARTFITGGSTLLTALVLFFVATGDINDIALTLIIGVVVGTFSSLFIACPIFYWWHKGDRRHVEKHHDVAPKYEWSGTSRAAE
ncbi:MAG TPA: protein translocase subunit SecD [Opitutaceae bacterium]|nr:protein translocase subunit SecD [Opitutaceae bacterium]HRJ46142.1 protein translocase subunit SecD [Opitutaceae bacterium]